ncbi:hypothetical protein PVAP13_5KG100987 [Panicum virgatum]|uniref:Uncharacterized protein n=1 Tax=Panicum virgatum TaxID=38727 RepID=A0A8T0SGT1_PANVG|nr:hypothetical protein PVAP13_5KG100987 [Panicum virgatum]
MRRLPCPLQDACERMPPPGPASRDPSARLRRRQVKRPFFSLLSSLSSTPVDGPGPSAAAAIFAISASRRREEARWLTPARATAHRCGPPSPTARSHLVLSR